MLTHHEDIANRERDRIQFMMRRDGVTETLIWAERVNTTYKKLIGTPEWRWCEEELKGACIELESFILRKGILNKSRYEV